MKIIFALMMFFAFAIALALLLAFPTMLLWNWLMPVIFGLPVISFWQSLGLCLLVRSMFGTGSSTSSSSK